jgi:hypothetical protein
MLGAATVKEGRMGDTGTRITDVVYDAHSGTYRAALTLYGPGGIRTVQVSAPGRPGWGYERTLQALTEAARRAPGEALARPG